MYVVVNLPEIEYCNTKDDALCPEDSAYYYNTNVVFDREGRIIARYLISIKLIEFSFHMEIISFYLILTILGTENIICSES